MEDKKYNKSIIQRDTLKSLWVNVNIWEKIKKGTGFHRRSKNISATNSPAPTNSTLASARTRSATQQQQHTRQICTSQLHLFSTIEINIERINDEIEHPEIAEDKISIMEKKQSGEMTFTC